MIDILDQLNSWIKQEKPLALATVIQTWGSSPRQIGSAMAIREDQQIAGSVSGGCVEAEVINTALDTLKDNKSRILQFGISDDTAWSVGLSCGGTIKVFVEKHPAFSENPEEMEIWNRLIHAIMENNPVILAKKLTEEPSALNKHLLIYPDGTHLGDWGAHTSQVKGIALKQYQQRKNGAMQVADQRIFFQIFARKPKLIIVGGSHIAIPLVSFAHELNFESIIIDPREIFTSKERFSAQPKEIIADWPQNVLPDLELNEDIYAVLLTHDPKIDDEALKILLKSQVAYIGALGSKKTHAKRCARLKEAGLRNAELERIHGPVGLDIDASSPTEIALSIMAEIIGVKNE